MKALVDWCDAGIKPFPPSTYWNSQTGEYKKHFTLKNELRTQKEIPGFDKEKNSPRS